MTPLDGAITKFSEVCLLYPLHTIIHKKQTNMPIQFNSSLYKGIHFQLLSSSINRSADIFFFQKSNSTIEASFYSTFFKTLTYPLHTIEINYQLKNKYPKIHNLYKGFGIYTIGNFLSYNVWIESLKFYNSHYLYRDNDYVKRFTVGFLSGLTTDIAIHPIKVIKTNIQNKTFFIKDLTKMSYYIRGMNYKIILSGFQTAYFNLFCNFVNNN